MKLIDIKQVRNFRKERNSDLIQRMRNGDQLTSFNSYASWYPPRPIIEKDSRAVRELYGQDAKRKHSRPEQRTEEEVQPLRLA